MSRPLHFTRNASIASPMVMRSGVAGGADGSGTGSVVHRPETSSFAAIARAASHSHWPVVRRVNFLLRVPETKIGQSHRFQAFLRSSYSDVRSSSECPD